MRLEEKVAKLLIKQKKTLSLAESCTGGFLANRMTDISGSSKFLKAGLVTYSNDAKMKLLKIPLFSLKKYGAVSEPVASQMARNARKMFKTDYGIGITGIAGPTGGTKNKPVGLVYLALDTPQRTVCLQCNFKGSRTSIKRQVTTQALKLLLAFLKT